MYYFQFYVALWFDKPLCVIYKEKYLSSGEPFCSETKLSDKKVLAWLTGLAQQSRLHGTFSARLRDAGISASRAEIFPCNREVCVLQACRDPDKPSQPA